MRMTAALAQQPLEFSLFSPDGPQGIPQSPALLLQAPDLDTSLKTKAAAIAVHNATGRWRRTKLKDWFSA